MSIVAIDENLKFNLPQAFVAILLGVCSADGDLDEREKEALSVSLRSLKCLRGYEPAYLQNQFRQVGPKIRGQTVEVVVGAIKNALRPEMRETAFLVVAEMALADGVLGEQEQRLLQRLQQDLEIDEQVAAEIMRVVLIKNRE